MHRTNASVLLLLLLLLISNIAKQATLKHFFGHLTSQFINQLLMSFIVQRIDGDNNGWALCLRSATNGASIPPKRRRSSNGSASGAGDNAGNGRSDEPSDALAPDGSGHAHDAEAANPTKYAEWYVCQSVRRIGCRGGRIPQLVPDRSGLGRRRLRLPAAQHGRPSYAPDVSAVSLNFFGALVVVANSPVITTTTSRSDHTEAGLQLTADRRCKTKWSNCEHIICRVLVTFLLSIVHLIRWISSFSSKEIVCDHFCLRFSLSDKQL